MRFAYADPPYIGQAKKHYGKFGGSEVDHRDLIAQLEAYDGWALSLSSTSLQQILAMCPNDVRISAWVKPFCSFKATNPPYAWEPIIWKSSSKRKRDEIYVRDWIAASITMHRHITWQGEKTEFHGAKPDQFCYWLFEILNIQLGDVFDDLFPGSYAVSKAFEQWLSAKKAWTNDKGKCLELPF